jgi:hypothetical protein
VKSADFAKRCAEHHLHISPVSTAGNPAKQGGGSPA